MAVYDRWHTRRPRIVDRQPVKPCREHKMYPSADHGQGDRWQVRWRDNDGKQCKANRPKKGGRKGEGNPDIYAEALDAKLTAELNTDSYIDPAAGKKLFKQYAEEVFADRVLDPSTRIEMAKRLGKHVYPVIGGKELRTLSRRPTLIQNLVARLEKELAPSFVHVIMAHVGTVFACAIDDELIAKNPVKAKSVVRLPRKTRAKVVPWTAEQIAGMREELPEQFAATVDAGAGLGLRQGEIFGLSPDDIEWLDKEPVVHVRRQVKVLGTELVFAPPKGEKTRDVELSDSVKIALAEHVRLHPPVEVTLPWKDVDGDPETVRLFFPLRPGRAVHRDPFNRRIWKPALERLGIPATRENGMHALRHYFASVLLAEGESVQAVSEWLGHHSPTITLEIYVHLMPKSKARMRKIIDGALRVDREESARNVPSGEE
jgi:integrase